jgi:hypothetical protein
VIFIDSKRVAADGLKEFEPEKVQLVVIQKCSTQDLFFLGNLKVKMKVLIVVCAVAFFVGTSARSIEEKAKEECK